MSQLTKKAIEEAFHDLLETTPFDKITVSAITKKCGIHHNTFYYHYKDIYELLEEWLTGRRGAKVQIRVPQRGMKNKLVAMAVKLN